MTISTMIAGVLLPVLGAAAHVAGRQQSSPPAEREYGSLRPLRPEEEGTGLNRLPNGVFGYTYAPLSFEAPLFAVRRYQSFEVQKRSDGAAEVVGYVTPADAERLRTGESDIFVMLYPEPFGEAHTPVSVPHARLGNSKERAVRQPGNPVKLLLG